MMADPMLYEDDIIFDDDDPDFAPTEDQNYDWYRPEPVTLDQCSERPCGRLIRCRTLSSHRPSRGLPRIKRVFDLAGLQGEILNVEETEVTVPEVIEDMLTLEHLRERLFSCLSCGVNWKDDQVSLDCEECGGYSMDRPCPVCDGTCSNQWTRDLCKTHTFSKAHWEGSCRLYPTHGKLLRPENPSAPLQPSHTRPDRQTVVETSH